MQPDVPREGKLGKFTGRTVLIIVLVASGPLVWGQTKPKPTQSAPDPELQTQKPSAQPLQTQQLPAQLPQTQQPPGGSKTAPVPSGEVFLMPVPKGWKQA